MRGSTAFMVISFVNESGAAPAAVGEAGQPVEQEAEQADEKNAGHQFAIGHAVARIEDEIAETGVDAEHLGRHENDPDQADRQADAGQQVAGDRRYGHLQQALTPVRENVENLAASQPDLRDVFLCHAWDDRQGSAKELHDLLEARGVRVWFSEKDLGLGVPMMRAIDKGLVNSRASCCSCPKWPTA